MKPAVEHEAPKGPQQPIQFPRTQIPSSSVFGFPVLINQFQTLQDSKPAASTGQVQVSDRLVDPRRTRLARLQAARRDAE